MDPDLSEVTVVDFSKELDRRGLKHILVFEDVDGEIQIAVGGHTAFALGMMQYCAMPMLERDLRRRFSCDGEAG